MAHEPYYKATASFFEEPLLVDRKDGTILVQLHMGRIRVECNLDKFNVKQGVADSGSTIGVLLTPKCIVAEESNKEGKRVESAV